MAYYLEAILLGILQGIAEFLPISSDGHLTVFGKILGELLGTGGSMNPEENRRLLLMVIVLHIGSLATLIVVFWKDLLDLLKKPKLVGWILLTTAITAIIAIPFKKQLESMFDSPTIAAVGWLITAAFLWFAERMKNNTLKLEDLGWKQSVVVGIFQAIAPVPGISRSGTTITAGLLTGLDRESSARYSFLIAMPAIAGAAILEIVKPLVEIFLKGKPAAEAFPGTDLSVAGLAPLVVGAIVSFLVGLVALKWLIQFIVKRGMNWFIIYLVVMATLTLLWQAIATTVTVPV
ncbi:MAG: undecaprenyl-diphosphate phosphatase [Planctomycetota bacterium]|nr:undecaprenyl-diphosphate phosphatase [Planctomycetota bacterium]